MPEPAKDLGPELEAVHARSEITRPSQPASYHLPEQRPETLPQVRAHRVKATVVDASASLLPSSSTCSVAGPMADAARARAVAARLQALGGTTRVARRPVPEPFGYIVVTAQSPDIDAARQLARRLRNSDVRDMQVIPTGAFANRVSLGVYAGPESGERRRTELAARGIVTEMLPRTRTRVRWFVSSDLPMDRARDGLDSEALGGARFLSEACGADQHRARNSNDVDDAS